MHYFYFMEKWYFVQIYISSHSNNLESCDVMISISTHKVEQYF